MSHGQASDLLDLPVQILKVLCHFTALLQYEDVESRRQKPSAIACLSSCNTRLRKAAVPFVFFNASGAAGTHLKQHVRHAKLIPRKGLVGNTLRVDNLEALPQLESLVVDGSRLPSDVTYQLAVYSHASSITFHKFEDHADLFASYLRSIVYDLSDPTLDHRTHLLTRLAVSGQLAIAQFHGVTHIKIVWPDAGSAASLPFNLWPNLRSLHLSIPFEEFDSILDTAGHGRQSRGSGQLPLNNILFTAGWPLTSFHLSVRHQSGRPVKRPYAVMSRTLIRLSMTSDASLKDLSVNDCLRMQPADTGLLVGMWPNLEKLEFGSQIEWFGTYKGHLVALSALKKLKTLTIPLWSSIEDKFKVPEDIVKYIATDLPQLQLLCLRGRKTEPQWWRISSVDGEEEMQVDAVTFTDMNLCRP